MPKNPKDVLSNESPNPKPKGPLGYSGNSLLGKAANWYANKQIFDEMKPRQVPQNEVPEIRNNAIPGPPGSKNMAQLEVVHMDYVSPESGNRHQIEGYHLPAQPGKPTVVFFGGSDMDRTAPQYKQLIENMANDLKKQGVGLLVMDYPPNANEKKIQSFVGQVQNYLVAELNVPMNKQAYSGYSLGGNPALLAANYNPDAAGLHLTATVSSIRQETKNGMKEKAPKISRAADKGELTTLMDNISETRKLVEAQNQRQTPMPVSIVYSNQDQFGREGNNHMTPLLDEFEQYPGAVEVAVSEAPAPTPEQAHENVLNSFENLEGIKDFAKAATAFSQGPQVVQQVEEQNAQGNNINPPQAQNQPIQPDPELVANAPNYPAPPPPGQDAQGIDPNPPQAQNQPIQPDPELVANSPNYPAPPPPGQDAQGVDANPPQAQNQPIQPDPELVANAPNYPAPPPPGEDAQGIDANPPQAQNQPIQPDPEQVAKVPDNEASPVSWKPAHEMSPEELQQFINEADALAKLSPHGLPPEQAEQRKKAIMAKLPPFEGKLSDMLDISEFVELDDEGIDQFIRENLDGQAIMKDVVGGDVFAPRQYAMLMFANDDHQAKRAAVEARLTQVLVLKPLQKEIERVKAELAELEQTPGIKPDDERIAAKKEQLADLYQDLSQCELRLEANKEAMNRARRKNRVAPSNVEAKAEAEVLKNKVKAPTRVTTNNKPEQLQEENLDLYRKPKLIDASVLALEGMQLDQAGYRPLQSGPHAIAEAYRAEFQSRLIRKRNNQPENLPEEIQGELQDELAQDAKLNAQAQEAANMMQPVIDQLNVLQKQKAELNDKIDQKREDLVQQLAENPSLIEDAAVRAKAEGAKAALLQAEEIIQQCDNQLAALENPDQQTADAAIQLHGSVEAAKEHYKKEKKEAVQKKGAAEVQLSQAIRPIVGPLVEKDPETLSIKAQIAELKGQQEALIQQYKEEKTAEAQAIREKRPDQRVAVGTEVKDAIEPGNQVAPGSDRKGGIKPSARHEANPGTPLKLQEEELRRNIDQAPYQQYQANVAMAEEEFKMRPEIIEDPAKRDQGVALKQQMAELQAKIAQYDKELGRLDQGKVGARLRGLASGGTKAAKESYAQKKAAAQEELASLEKQLNDLAKDAVSVSMKQDLLNAVKPPAQAQSEKQVAADLNQAVPVNQPMQPNEALADDVHNHPAPPPPVQEMSKKPKTKISAKAKDAGDGMPVAPPLVKGPPNPDLLAKAPRYPAPPPPEDEASLTPKTSMTDEQIDKAINDHFPHNQVAADLQKGDGPNYRDIASKISGAVRPSNMADRQAIEVRLIEKREIEPLRAQIEKLEVELEALEKTPGLEPGDKRVEAQKAQLNELYEALDNWEVRVETLKRGMALDDRKNRLAALNAELEVEKQALDGVEKVDKVHFAEGLDEPAAERHQARLQAASGFAATSLAESEIQREFTAQDIKAEIKKGFGEKYDVAYSGPNEDLDVLVDELKPVIDKVNLLQKEIRQLDEAHDQILIQKCGDFEQDPSRIANGAQRERVENAKLDYQQAAERVQHCDKRIAALTSPGPLELAKAVMQHGSLEKAREHYQNEKREATKQRNDSRRNLDDGLMNAARDAVKQSPEAKALIDQIEGLRQEQKAVLQQFGQQKMAAAEEALSQLIDHANSLNPSKPAVAGNDLKSGLKASAAVETNNGTLSRAADRAQRDNRLKPTVQEQLNHDHGGNGQQAKHEAAPGSLRANWKAPVKRPQPVKANGPAIGKH